MRSHRQRIDMASVENANYLHKDRIEHYEQMLLNYRKDPQKADRLSKQECVVCFYGSRIGGAAITFRDRAFCGDRCTSGNTNVDVMCRSCAKQAGLCKHCGADMDYKNRRTRNWPEVKEIPDGHDEG